MNDHTPNTRLSSREEGQSPAVFARSGEAFANSRDVARHFGKEVKHVHEAIRNLASKEPEWGALNFRPNEIKDLTGQSISHYDMTRDGLTMLAMGFTGAKALRWKLKYIEAFNAMEATLRAQPTPTINFADPQVLLGVMQHLQGQLSDMDRVIAEQGERLEQMDRLEHSVGSICLTDSAKTLKVGPQKLIQFLSSRSWIYKRVGNSSWLARQDKITSGYLEHKEHTYFDSTGQERVATRAMVTGKGLLKIAELLNLPLH